MKKPTGKLAFAYSTIANLEAECKALRGLLAQILPYAEEKVQDELNDGGCGPQMAADLELIKAARRMVQ